MTYYCISEDDIMTIIMGSKDHECCEELYCRDQLKILSLGVINEDDFDIIQKISSQISL